MEYTIVSEYVSSGHPDKLADQISDNILDHYLKEDPNARCGIEVLVKDNIVVVSGEVNSSAKINVDEAVREVFSEVKYPPSHNLAPNNINVINLMGQQSPEISSGVLDGDKIIGAGDQGLMVGYASNETEFYMPLGHEIAKRICELVSRYSTGLGPDAKTQVAVKYVDGTAVEISHILVSVQHETDDLDSVRKYVKDLINNVSPLSFSKDIYEKFFNGRDIHIDVNPCGVWHIGGPISDSGMTGRKIVVDAYGGYCNVGGGAYSGKDFSKVDRSAAYACRYLAKNIVASGICDNAKVTVSYMIGVAQPRTLDIELNRNQELAPKIKQWIIENIDLTPSGISEMFCGSVPRYRHTATYGHYGFGCKADQPASLLIYPWEKIDFADKLAELAK